jgi:hypothetical protein
MQLISCTGYVKCYSEYYIHMQHYYLVASTLSFYLFLFILYFFKFLISPLKHSDIHFFFHVW